MTIKKLFVIKKYNRYIKLLFPYWKKEAVILLLSSAGIGLALINPYLTKIIIDKAYGQKDIRLFIALVAAVVAIFILSEFLNTISNYLNRYIRLRISLDLSRGILKKLQNLPYSFYQDNPSVQHLYRMNYDVEQISRFISEIFPQVISLISRSMLIFAIIIYLDRHIALFTLLLASLVWFVPYYFNARLRRIFKEWVEDFQRLFVKLQEMLSHIQLVKSFGREQKDAKNYVGGLIKNIRISLRNAKIEIFALYANNIASRLILGAIIFYGGYQVIKGNMTLGSLSAISIYLTQLSGIQNSFAGFSQQIAYGAVSYERLEDIFSVDPCAFQGINARRVGFQEGKIEFKNVTFGYGKEKKIFENVSFSIPGSSAIGLVGPSGSGKTTLLNLILRLYKPSAGEILIDGRNINDIKSESLYGQIGVALQEPYLWNDTIENNIRYGKEDASFEEIKEAAGIACADEFIELLPEKYATIIGENACKISEGQKQRIAIARAIIKKPKILILDEALSSVDMLTEGRILERIGKLSNVTVIVVSHHHSTISGMHSVCFLSSPQDIKITKNNEFIKEHFLCPVSSATNYKENK